MPYVPRAPRALICAHCGVAFTAVHLRRKYCCNSCNVLAAHARGRTGARLAANGLRPGPPPPLLEHLVQVVGAVTPVGVPRPIGSDVSQAIDPRIAVQLHVLARPVYLCDLRVKPLHPYIVKECWVADDGSCWIQDRASLHQTLWWVNGTHPQSLQPRRL